MKNGQIDELWNLIYNLSLQMLHSRTDAEDATQSIFEKIIGAYPSFRGESKLSTWCYRIAFNYLTDIKRSQSREKISFEVFEKDISAFKPYDNELALNREEEKIYIEEIKVGCTLAMLQCLDSESRFIFILSNIFGIAGKEGAEICGTSSDSYRQKASRAKRKIGNFIRKNCGLINPEARCQCRKRLLIAVERGRVNQEKLLYRTEDPRIKDFIGEMNDMDEISGIFRDNPFYLSSMKGRYAILGESAEDNFN